MNIYDIMQQYNTIYIYIYIYMYMYIYIYYIYYIYIYIKIYRFEFAQIISTTNIKILIFFQSQRPEILS